MKSFVDGIVNQLTVKNTKRLFEHSWFGALMGSTSKEAQLRSYGSVGTLFAIVSRIAESLAGTDWRLYRKAASGNTEDRKVVASHAILDLWNQPNPFFNGFAYRETLSQHLDLTGEAYVVVVRSRIANGLPLELWPVRPDRMEPVSHVTKFLAGYLYHGPNGEEVPLELDEVIPIYWTDPMHPGQRGMGPVQSLLTDIDSARFSAEWNRNFFVNGAQPGGIVEVDKRLSDDEWGEMVQRWRDQHRGVANAHRVAVIEQGKWKETKYSMRDMQFTELRNVSREIIREAFGYPKIMLGTVDDVNRANAEVGEEMFGRWLQVPRLDRIRDAHNAKLLPMFGDTARKVELDYLNPVPSSREADDRERDSKWQAAQRGVLAGYDPEDVRVALDLPEMRHTGQVFDGASFGGGGE